MPGVVELYKEFKDKGLGIVGVSLDNDANAWKKAIDQLKMTWPQMSDLRGWDNAAAQMLSITSIPHTVIVDSKGVILARGLRGEELRQFVAERLK
jgi:alkyl hydroperoxide reductase subunit AhpC